MRGEQLDPGRLWFSIYFTTISLSLFMTIYNNNRLFVRRGGTRNPALYGTTSAVLVPGPVMTTDEFSLLERT